MCDDYYDNYYFCCEIVFYTLLNDATSQFPFRLHRHSTQQQKENSKSQYSVAVLKSSDIPSLLRLIWHYYSNTNCGHNIDIYTDT